MQLQVTTTVLVALLCLAQAEAWQFNTANLNVFDPNFGSKLNQQIQSQVGGILSNVQQQVSSNVNNVILPIAANVIRINMAQGVGGTTVITFGDKTILEQNYRRNLCHGTVSKKFENGYYRVSCAGNLEQMDPNNECFPQSWSRVGDTFCFGTNVIFQCIGNSCSCQGGTLIKLQDLQKKCGENFGTNRYLHFDYYPDNTQEHHIPIPNPNPYVYCDNKDPGHCEWYGGSPWL